MTTNDAATLLRTYADALEATHPVPADQTDLAATIAELDDEPITELDISLFEAPAEPRFGRLTVAALSLAAALALITGLVLLNDDADVRTGDSTDPSGFVFEGETVIREDPLVVIANQPAEPTFDTSSLGERIVWDSPLDLDDEALDATVESIIGTTELMLFNGADVEIRRIALHAIVDSGPIGVAIADVEIPSSDGPGESEITRRRLVFYDNGGGISGQAGPDDALPENRPAATFAEYLERNPGLETFSYGGGGPEDGVGDVTIQLEVSLDIAVMQIIVDGESFWTVPIDGFVYFTPTMELTTMFELTAYDAEGNVVTSRVSGFSK